MVQLDPLEKGNRTKDVANSVGSLVGIRVRMGWTFGARKWREVV